MDVGRGHAAAAACHQTQFLRSFRSKKVTHYTSCSWFITACMLAGSL